VDKSYQARSFAQELQLQYGQILANDQRLTTNDQRLPFAED